MKERERARESDSTTKTSPQNALTHAKDEDRSLFTWYRKYQRDCHVIGNMEGNCIKQNRIMDVIITTMFRKT